MSEPTREHAPDPPSAATATTMPETATDPSAPVVESDAVARADQIASPDPTGSAGGGRSAEAAPGLRGVFPLRVLPPIALLAALLALVVTGLVWLRTGQLANALDEARAAETARAVALERLEATQRAATERTTELEAAVRGNDRALRELESRADRMPGQLADLQRRIDAVQGGTFGARVSWLVAEAEYYLGVANAELELTGRVETARAALRLADDRLRETSDPALGSIRDLIADEILALNAVRLVDTEGLAFSLGRLTARVESLPLRTAGTRSDASDARDRDDEAGLARLWSSVKGALSSIVSVERRGDETGVALTVEEGRLARRELAVELEIARLALIRREPEAYGQSLMAARQLLEADFDTRAAEIESASALLDELRSLEIAPPLPDVSRSLAALRARRGDE